MSNKRYNPPSPSRLSPLFNTKINENKKKHDHNTSPKKGLLDNKNDNKTNDIKNEDNDIEEQRKAIHQNGFLTSLNPSYVFFNYFII